MSMPFDNCIFWSKLENDSGYEIGNGLSEIGSTNFAAGKWNLGLSNSQTSNCLRAEATEDINPDNLFVEFYLRPSYNMINGIPASGNKGYFMIGQNPVAGYNKIELYSVAGYCFNIHIEFSGDNYNSVCTPAALNMTAGNNYHFGFAFNRAGIAGTAETVQIYFEKNKIWSDTHVYGPKVGSGFKAYIGADFNDFSLDGVIDNFRLYNDTSAALINAIIANKDNEGFPVSNTFRRGPVNYINNFPFNRPFARVE